MKTFFLPFTSMLFAFVAVVFAISGCKENAIHESSVQEYPADVAYAWIRMQQKLFIGTDLLPHVAGRTYAYMGLTLYESIVPGMSDYQSIAPQLNGELILPSTTAGENYFWPASANAALAFMLKSLLPSASPALLSGVDSVENHFYNQFQGETDAETLQRSVNFGRAIANAIFEWSKTDGGHEAYKSPFSAEYVPPTGPGMWVATGEFPFTQPVYPHWGENRTFIPGLAEATQPPPPPPYSEKPGSAFYEAANEIYLMSQHLTHDDSLNAKFWAYEPFNSDRPHEYDDISHAANIAVQLMMQKGFSLGEAALLFCKHGIAGNEAGISLVRTKFHYNLVRPITYIRTVMGHPKWSPVIPTPPFPEYTSGHAAASSAFATVLENAFGKKFNFTDHSFDNTYGPQSFDSFEAYAADAALSRLKAGIHYRFAMDEGLKQGKKVAARVEQLKFKK